MCIFNLDCKDIEASGTTVYYMKKTANRNRRTRFKVGLNSQSSMLNRGNMFALNKSIIYFRTF